MPSPDVLALEHSPVGRLEPIADGELAFIPAPLPRELTLSSALIQELGEADRAVGMLVGAAETLPNLRLLIEPLKHREAVLSSRIEGTQSSLSDLFEYEAVMRERGDVVEVYNYVQALDEAFRLMEERNLPISKRLMDSAHAVLMRHGVRGQDKRPGEFRDRQVWIGRAGTPMARARYVPPPPAMLRDLIYDLEEFANAETAIPPLLMCGMLHYRFEAVHPYEDGNGRIGRLLIILFLHARGLLPAPLLHMSAYFERNRQDYYQGLYEMSRTGDWEHWLRYFVWGVREQALDTLARVRRIRSLYDGYTDLLQGRGAPPSDYRLLDELFRRPIVTNAGASRTLGMSYPGARKVVQRLESAGILEEQRRGKRSIFAAAALLRVLEEESPLEGAPP